MGIRVLRIICGVSPGEYVWLSKLLLASAGILALPCLAIGCQFVLAARSARSAGAVYFSECLGSAAAGALTSLVLVPRLGGFALVFLAMVIHLLMGFAVSFALAGSGHRAWAERGLLCILPLVAALGLLPLVPRVESATRRAAWKAFNPDLELRMTRESAYGSIAVLERGGEFSVYQSGRLLFSLSDRGEAAPVTHLFLAQHEAPREVLLVGGGASGALKEILRHPVARVTYLELDPALVEVAKRFASPADRAALSDPRVRVLSRDGRGFLQRGGESLNLIIVNAPEPTTQQDNRFYTYEFFLSVKRRLAPGGVFCLGAVASEAGGQTEVLLRRNRIIYATLGRVFGRVLAVPGNPTCFLASDAEGKPTLQEGAVGARLSARGITGVNTAPLLDTFYIEKANAELRTGRAYNPLAEPIESAADRFPVNSDLHPVVYFLSVLYWSQVVGDHAAEMLLGKGSGALAWLILLGAVGCCIGGWVRERRTGRTGRATCLAVAVFACGLTGMALEMMVLYTFQNTYGSVYQAVGLILGLFMLGLAAGAHAGDRLAGAGNPVRRFTAGLWMLGGFALAAPILLFLPRLTDLPAFDISACAAVNFAAGCLVGGIYPLAVAAAPPEPDDGHSAGILYGSDLLGGCVGALVVSASILPLAGFFNTALFCAALCIGAAVLVRWGAILAGTQSRRTWLG